MRKIECIGILTSGGDAPGMNAAIRAVTRAAIANGFRVMGIYRGYEGLINNEIQEFTTENVSNIIQRGGTILKTARSKDFQTPEGRQRAYENMTARGIDALVVIGGNGSLTGARIFSQEFDVPCIGLPGTIDNDLDGTDLTIGYDTTLNTIMECVDKIRDTATSHERIFFVEVMGRDAGFLAQNSAMYYADRLRKEHPEFDVRVTILGHLQRGGSPSACDRVLASRLGTGAINALLEGQRNVMVGIRNDEIVYVPFSRAVKSDKVVKKELVDVLSVLSI